MATYETIGRSDEEYEPPIIEERSKEEDKAKKWTIPEGGSIESSVTVVDKIVYFGACDKHLYALSAKDGKLLWKFKTGGPVISTPTIIADTVYFSGNDGYFYALAKTGELKWRFRMGSEGESFSSPAVVEGKIFFGSHNGYIYCLNLDGKEEWKYRTGHRVVTSPAVVNDMVIVPSYDCNCYAITIDGRLVWKFVMGNSSGSSPAIADNKFNEIWRFRKFSNKDPGKIRVSSGLVFFGSWDNHLYAIDIDDGRRAWDYIAGGLIGSSPTVANGCVYVGSFDNHIHCLDAEDGRALWKVRTGGQVDSSPVVHKDMIYFGSFDGSIYALSLQGERSWNFLTGGLVGSSPTIDNDILFIGSFDTYLYALDLMTRKLPWKFQTGMPFQSQVKDQFKLITDITDHRFTRWKPEVIKSKASYDFKIDTAKPVAGDQPYQSSNTYQSNVGESYRVEKKKKRPEFGFF